jgi:septal ring factor EnvC (AmiA/AmiB activator)
LFRKLTLKIFSVFLLIILCSCAHGNHGTAEALQNLEKEVKKMNNETMALKKRLYETESKIDEMNAKSKADALEIERLREVLRNAMRELELRDTED